MIDRDKLIQNNQQWQLDDDDWFNDIERWQRQTQQWIALLYLLEKNLPEQTTSIDRHRAEIVEHKADLLRYSCGLNEKCIPSCDNHVTGPELKKAYEKLASSHNHMVQTHQRLQKDFEDKRQKLKELAERLIDALTLED